MQFSRDDSLTLLNIMSSRRDVRGNDFIAKEIEEEKIELILRSALTAPSVGYSQPWEFVIINDKKTKEKIHKNFERKISFEINSSRGVFSREKSREERFSNSFFQKPSFRFEKKTFKI